MIVPTDHTLAVSAGTLHSLVEYWIASGMIVTEQIARADLWYWATIDCLKSPGEFAERWGWPYREAWNLIARLGLQGKLPPRTRARDVDIYSSVEEENTHHTPPHTEGEAFLLEEDYALLHSGDVESEEGGDRPAREAVLGLPGRNETRGSR
jgi:hypothetical protein